MIKNTVRTIAAAAVVALLATAFGSSNSGASEGSGKTITIGVLEDYTGPGASGTKAYLNGVEAGIVLAKHEGYTIKYVLGDTQTSPGGALSIAQRLVAEDHVNVVLAESAVAFAAAPYLMSQHIPVIGAPIDSSEWGTDTNMFSVEGALHITAVTSTFGQLLKLLGATTVATLGYGISPASADSAIGVAKSAAAAGLKTGYVNSNFPFGSTNVGPVALELKAAHVDSIYPAVETNTALALITALRQMDVNLKAAILPDGYGADILQAGPGAVQQAQDAYFLLGFEPVEMGTPATKQFQADLAAAGTTGVPTDAEYFGYTSVGLLLQALKSAGSKPTSASILSALQGIHSWGALGLWGGRTININDRTQVLTSIRCTWMVKLVGKGFKLVKGAEPLCGDVLPGVTAGS